MRQNKRDIQFLLTKRWTTYFPFMLHFQIVCIVQKKLKCGSILWCMMVNAFMPESADQSYTLNTNHI